MSILKVQKFDKLKKKDEQLTPDDIMLDGKTVTIAM